MKHNVTPLAAEIIDPVGTVLVGVEAEDRADTVGAKSRREAGRDGAGFTTADVARRLRVGEDTVRTWIKRGELVAVNTAAALCGKPRWIVTPAALEAFERRRSSGNAVKPIRRRGRLPVVDYFPD
jgi:hypothetical protein